MKKFRVEIYNPLEIEIEAETEEEARLIANNSSIKDWSCALNFDELVDCLEITEIE